MDYITLAHGAGGVEMAEILEKLFFRRIEDRFKRVEGGIGIDIADDAAAIPIPGGGFIVVSTDSYTVNPIFFPGGDIGLLAAAGSINDVLMLGGRPIAVLDSIVVEEGFPVGDLEKVVESMIRVFREEGVALIGGDFKVMPRGQLDKIIITTTAIGVAEKPIIDRPRPGDKILVSDFIGDHGAVVMILQMTPERDIEELLSRDLVKSDVKPLTKLMLPLIDRYRDCITAARDPTRGGLAGVLNEWASRSSVLITIEEKKIPIREQVKKYSEAMGIDPLYLASEGVAVLSLRQQCVEEVLGYIRDMGFENAGIIGEVRETDIFGGYVAVETEIGGLRLLDPPRGELVPRIC